MASWLDNLQDYGSTSWDQLTDPILNSAFRTSLQSGMRRLADDPNALVNQYYGEKGAEVGRYSRARSAVEGLNASFLSGLGHAVGGAQNFSDALGGGYDYLFGAQDPTKISADLDAAKKTAEQAMAPSPEAQAAAVAQEKAKAELDKQASIEQLNQALLNAGAFTGGRGSSAKGGGAAGVLPGDVGAPPAEQPQPEKEDDTLSKAMLRAGVAMLKSKGDIWDALGSGFGAYQDTLDKAEADVSAAQKDQRDFALEKYKADIYARQTEFPYWKAQQGGGDGVSLKDLIAQRKLDLQEQKQQQVDDINTMKVWLDIQSAIDNAPDPETRAKYLSAQYRILGGGAPGAGSVSSAVAKGYKPTGSTVPVLP